MSKKVLVISASPRVHGNSDLLCDEFIKGAVDAGNEVEKISLRDKKIGYCQACETCYTNGGKCFQKDDMAEILDKMINADVIAMGTPVYFYSLNAQMKTLIDRSVSKYLEITNKDFYFFMTATDENKNAMNRTLECFRGWLDCLYKSNEKGVIYGAGASKKGDIKNMPELQEAYNYGKNV